MFLRVRLSAITIIERIKGVNVHKIIFIYLSGSLYIISEKLTKHKLIKTFIFLKKMKI